MSRAATVAMLSGLPHIVATKRLCNCSWMRGPTSTHGATSIGMLSRLPHLDTTNGLCACSWRRRPTSMRKVVARQCSLGCLLYQG